MKKDSQLPKVAVIGGGLAGCEAAWFLGNRGIPTVLYEMRPLQTTGAHQTPFLAELVCSNSFRAADPLRSAVGLLQQELAALQSLIITTARRYAVGAGGALAVDRDLFAQAVTRTLENHPLIEIRRQSCDHFDVGADYVIGATGPLTSEPLGQALQRIIGSRNLFFYDALAPIVYKESVDMTHAWYQNRYDRGAGADYINCPLDEDTYRRFFEALGAAETRAFKEFEKKDGRIPFFEGCLPIEVLAQRGAQTLLFGPMKPVGLTDPRTGRRPFAAVQLRADNRTATLYNMVGFQTKMTYDAQKEVLRLIPALQNASFARLGSIHRNTYVDGPSCLRADLSLKKNDRIFLAGQITGCEGYVESTACGFLAALACFCRLEERAFRPPPTTTALGGLWAHITQPRSAPYTPMNITFGLLDPPAKKARRTQRKENLSRRAQEAFGLWRADLEKTVFTTAGG